MGAHTLHNACSLQIRNQFWAYGELYTRQTGKTFPQYSHPWGRGFESLLAHQEEGPGYDSPGPFLLLSCLCPHPAHFFARIWCHSPSSFVACTARKQPNLHEI